MAENTRWNKKIFALLLEEAKGVRSWRQFASECDVSYVQMRKLARGTQENPPRPKLIRKVAAHAFGEIDLEDLMFAAGIRTGEPVQPRESEKAVNTPNEKYNSLSPKDRKTAEMFVEFLLSREEEAKKKQKKEAAKQTPKKTK